MLGSYDDADEHLAYAAARHEDWGAALYLARTWADQAELLLTRHGAPAVDDANDLLGRARAVGRDREALGVDQYVNRVQYRARGRGIEL